MRRRRSATPSLLCCLQLATLACGVRPADAAERLLAELAADSGAIVVQFNCPMSYVSHNPLRSGKELRIELQPLPGCVLTNGFAESWPVPDNNGAGLVAVDLDIAMGTRRALTLRFAHSVEYIVRPRSGLTALEILLARRVGTARAEPAAEPPPASRTATRALPAPAELDRLAEEARKALAMRDYDGAIRAYTRLLEYPEHAARAQAQEYLGLARERKGQLALAKQEYQEYLHRYPEGPDAGQVAQRLAALVTLEGATTPVRGAPDASPWQLQGAIFQEYRHDQNTVSAAGFSAPGIGQSALDTETDLSVRRRGDRFDFRGRLDLGYLHDFSGASRLPGTTDLRLPAAYAEIDDTVHHWSTRLGRQSEATGGIYATFDGLYAGWRLWPGLRINVAAGAPVPVYEARFSLQRVFTSVSADFISIAPGLDISAFMLEQTDQGYLDERQVGGELRYYRSGRSVVAQFDYDVSYRVVNAVTVLATLDLPQRWVFTGLLDHRRSPFIATYDSLIGQPTTSLRTLERQHGSAAVRQLALDRSAGSDTATIGLQHPLGEQLQWWNDVTIGRLAGTPASGGVPAVPGTGNTVAYSSQLLGGGWLMDGDLHVLGMGYSTASGTRDATLYVSGRYPLGDHLRMGPRLSLDDVTASPSNGATRGWSASPALLADWRARRVSFDAEIGYSRASQSIAPGIPASGPPTVGPVVGPPTLLGVGENTRRFWFSVGYHLSF